MWKQTSFFEFYKIIGKNNGFKFQMIIECFKC